MPHLTEMAKKYAGKATFTGVNVWEEKNPTDDSYFAKVEEFVAKKGDTMGYNIAIDGHEGVMAKTWMQAAGQNGIPASFVIDRDSKIVWIGHPMGGLDEVVGKVIDGTFDAKAEADKQAKARDAQQKQMALVQTFQKPLKEGKYREAVAAIDKLIAEKTFTEMQLATTRFSALANYDPTGANAYALKVADMFKNQPMALNNLAWMMVDDQHPIKGMDPKIALQIAQKCVAATKADDPMLAYNLDTLATCYFKAGQIDKAIETQDRALKAADATKDFDPATRKEIASRLDTFKQKKGGG